ncbi:hypothetical protein CDAR_30591 [Caerostris darwini]|uniref:Uncharacterized protein n=1 Tax=Caerostris darwini TaxID=1538125 RepID=A0AAV4U4F0_9ARAC|nr:hypothetical protein CDAR_30591 [Caerostris darwini]
MKQKCLDPCWSSAVFLFPLNSLAPARPHPFHFKRAFLLLIYMGPITNAPLSDHGTGIALGLLWGREHWQKLPRPLLPFESGYLSPKRNYIFLGLKKMVFSR